MQKWEYMTILPSGAERGMRAADVNGHELPNWRRGPELTTYLNQLGQDGWEIVGAGTWAQLHIIYLKRPKP